MVTKQFALELGRQQICVNSVSPTCVLTDFVKDQIEKAPEMEQKFNSVTPLGRLCEVREVVDPVIYLLSDHSSMVSSTVSVVDDGVLSNIAV